MDLIDPSSVLSFALSSLRDLVLYEYDILGGANGRVKELDDWVATLEGFVNEYTRERYIHNEYVKGIMKQIRRKLHESEDIVDAYMHTVFLHRSRPRLEKLLQAGADIWGLHKVGQELAEQLKSLEKYKEKIQDGMQAAQVDESFAGSPPVDGQENRYNFKPSDVVGFEDRANVVINYLKAESEKKDLQQLPVVTITGMFGLGKTTLAKVVFEHPRVLQTFTHPAFVEVSNYSTTKVFLAILGAFLGKTEEAEGIRDDNQLAEKVKEELKKRTYLIVLDDVRDEEVLRDLQSAFPIQTGSAVLITRRHHDLSLHAKPSGVTYQLDFLTPDQGDDLLRKEAGLRSKGTNPADDHYVSKIVEKCQRLPLSIVLAAGVLRKMTEQRDRLNLVSQSLDEYVAKDQNHTGPIKLSYEMLPFELKQCFLYLGVFHRGSGIPVWKLLRLWLAEGFIQPSHNMSLEARAEACLQDLVARNLVMVKERKLNGHIKTCIIHDAVHVFCNQEAEKELLFQEIQGDEAATPNLDSAAYRRLCIKPEILPSINPKDALQKVRSFLCFASKETPFAPGASSPISKGFKLLRVLDFKSMNFSSFPDELHSLVLLKYLAMFCDSDTLPANICKLLNLQTLIYGTSSQTVTVKADIWKMSLLRHLHTNSSIVLPSSSQFSQSQRLQTLCTVSSESCTEELFKRVPKLNKLGISGKLNTLLEANGGPCAFAGISKYIKNVQNLKLVNEDIKFSPKGLDPKSFPTTVARLTLKNIELNSQHMTALGLLQFLQVLKLKKTVFQEGKLETSAQDFRGLKVLYIGETNLKEWTSSEKHFPSLECLALRDCGKLNAIPSGLGKIESFQKIVLYSPNPSLESSATAIEVLKLQKGAPFTLSVHHIKEQAKSEEILPSKPRKERKNVFRRIAAKVRKAF